MTDNFFMDEDLFTALQKEICWFAFSPFEKLPPIDPTLDLDDLATGVGDTRVQRHAFAMIFGAHGYQRDLKRAEILCVAKLGSLEQIEPKTKDLNDPQYAFWLNQLAKYNILLGTIFAYEHDYILAAALLMNGLKTGAIDLSNAYCDFIRFVLSKVEEMPAPLMECEGLGFSADDPMGGTATQGGRMNPGAAHEVIGALEPNGKGVILAYCGRSGMFGKMRRRSTYSERFAQPIDVYDVLMCCTETMELKTLRLYFNAYFPADKPFAVRLPQGFHLDASNRAARLYNCVV